MKLSSQIESLICHVTITLIQDGNMMKPLNEHHLEMCVGGPMILGSMVVQVAHYIISHKR